MLGTMSLSMIGMIVLAPLIAHVLSPLLSAIPEWIVSMIFRHLVLLQRWQRMLRHLAFTMSFADEWVSSVILGKLVAGVLAVVIAWIIIRVICRDKKRR